MKGKRALTVADVQSRSNSSDQLGRLCSSKAASAANALFDRLPAEHVGVVEADDGHCLGLEVERRLRRGAEVGSESLVGSE